MSGVTSDTELMAAVAAGDQEALGQLYDRHGRLLLAICVKVLRDQAEAEEIVSAVFLELWRHSQRYDATRGAPIAYLINVARSRAIDRLRLRRREREIFQAEEQAPEAVHQLEDVPLTPLGDTLENERRRVVQQALALLQPAQRQALELNFFQGLSHSEVAAALGEPLGTVKTRIRKGLIVLREVLEPLYGGGALA